MNSAGIEKNIEYFTFYFSDRYNEYINRGRSVNKLALQVTAAFNLILPDYRCLVAQEYTRVGYRYQFFILKSSTEIRYK